MNLLKIKLFCLKTNSINYISPKGEIVNVDIAVPVVNVCCRDGCTNREKAYTKQPYHFNWKIWTEEFLKILRQGQVEGLSI